MDFRKIYEDGYHKHRKELSHTDRAYVAGFAKAYDEVESFYYNADDVYDEVSETEIDTLANIKREIRAQVINDLRDWLRVEWYEMLVSMIDETEDDVVKENDEYAIPEPLSEEDVTVE